MLKRTFTIFLLLIVGCSRQPATVAPPPPYLVHLPGIGGERRVDRKLVEGIVQGGYSGDFAIYDWTDNNHGIPSLVSYDHNKEKAQILADRLTAVHRANPNCRLIITAHSGGTGVAVWALEKLPPDVQVDRVILLASALSPMYDLSGALRHVSGRMFNFWSPLDVAILSLGTNVFGTIDGVKSPAAGFVGFYQPDSADKVQYQKLEQRPYDRAWIRLGNHGEHIGAMNQAFAQEILTPLIDGPLPAPVKK